MKMIRRLIIILCIVLFSLGIAGCSSCDNKEEPDPQAGYVQTITLKNEQLIVGLYMSDTIEYQGEGEATYNSDNPEIVSVDETGKITGLKVGKANVTVAIGEAKAVCEVTVVDTNETPYIKLAISDSEYNLLVEDYIQLNAKLIFAQEERAETITYESSSDSVVVDENGKLTAKKVGTATITVSANFFDKTITKLLKINVLNSPVVLNATTSNYVVYTNASKGNNDSVTLPNSVIEDEQIKNVDFTYEYDQSKLVNVDNVFKAKLPCVKDETVDVKMTYTDSEQKTYTFTIEVEIKLVNEDLEGKTTLILENGSSRAITDRGITLVYNEIDIPEEIVAVYENGIDLQYNKQTNEVQSPIDASGSSKWDLISANGIAYNVPVEFYDIVLYDSEDFKTILPYAANKHVVLAGDIGKVENYPQRFSRFTGTLDGRGYSVEEITYGRHPEWFTHGYLFYQFAGTIKNISFDNMKLLNTQSGIAQAVDSVATMENVFINATTDAAKSSSALFDDAYGEYKINLTNVVVIFNGMGAGTPYAIIGDGDEHNNHTARTVNCTNVFVSGVKSDNTAIAISPNDSAITGYEYKADYELYQLASSAQFATYLLNEKVLANVYNAVDKTETQIYDVEKWTRNDVSLTYDHSAKFIANADLSDNGSTVIEKITSNGIDLSYDPQTGKVDPSKLTVGTMIWNVHYPNGEVYKVTVHVADAIIRNATDFKEILPNATNEYIMLGNDIGKVENYPFKFSSFTGTLDGRGYSVEEISYARHPEWFVFGSLFYNFAGTIKNISFDNMKLLNTQSGIAQAVIGFATMENVFINAITDASNSATALFDDAYGEYQINLTNVVVIINGTGSGTPYAIIGDGDEHNNHTARAVNCTNVFVSGVKSDNTIIAISPNDSAITGCAYKTESELFEIANNGGFETELLNKKVLATVDSVVDKTETQIYYVEKWTKNNITLTYDHSAKFIANAGLSDKGSTTIQKITANGIDLGYNPQTGAVDASKLTVGTMIWSIHYGEYEIYKVTVHVADAIIRNATDFKEILPNATNEYIMLGNDIEKVESYPLTYTTFTGTLDGCGHSIGEISYGYSEYYTSGWLFYIFNGTIKNISFDKMSGLRGSAELNDYRQSGIAFQVGNGSALLENVFINATTSTGAEVNVMFGTAWGDAYITLREVVVIVKGTGTGSAYAIIGDNTSGRVTSVRNVYVSGANGSGVATPMSPSGNIAGCTYKTETELLQMANAGDSTLSEMAQDSIKNVLGE